MPGSDQAWLEFYPDWQLDHQVGEAKTWPALTMCFGTEALARLMGTMNAWLVRCLADAEKKSQQPCPAKMLGYDSCR